MLAMLRASTRREFLTALASAPLATLAVRPSAAAVATSTVGEEQQPRPRGSEFAFARLRYTSGDWDFNPKVAANVLNSLVEYTTIPVYGQEVVITADSKELFA